MEATKLLGVMEKKMETTKLLGVMEKKMETTKLLGVYWKRKWKLLHYGWGLQPNPKP